MKRKKIEPGEEFIMGTEVFSYNLIDGKLILKKVGPADVKPSNKPSPPSLDEVKAFFKEKGYMDAGAIKAYDYYTAMEWHDTNKKPVKNWKAKMIAVWMRDEYKIKEPINQQKQTHSNFFMSDGD